MSCTIYYQVFTKVGTTSSIASPYASIVNWALGRPHVLNAVPTSDLHAVYTITKNTFDKDHLVSICVYSFPAMSSPATYVDASQSTFNSVSGDQINSTHNFNFRTEGDDEITSERFYCICSMCDLIYF